MSAPARRSASLAERSTSSTTPATSTRRRSRSLLPDYSAPTPSARPRRTLPSEQTRPADHRQEVWRRWRGRAWAGVPDVRSAEPADGLPPHRLGTVGGAESAVVRTPGLQGTGADSRPQTRWLAVD